MADLMCIYKFTITTHVCIPYLQDYCGLLLPNCKWTCNVAYPPTSVAIESINKVSKHCFPKLWEQYISILCDLRKMSIEPHNLLKCNCFLKIASSLPAKLSYWPPNVWISNNQNSENITETWWVNCQKLMYIVSCLPNTHMRID